LQIGALWDYVPFQEMTLSTPSLSKNLFTTSLAFYVIAEPRGIVYYEGKKNCSTQKETSPLETS